MDVDPVTNHVPDERNSKRRNRNYRIENLRRWTTEEVSALADAYALPERRTFRALCRKFGRTEQAAIKRLQRLEIIKTVHPSIIPKRSRGGRPTSPKATGRQLVAFKAVADEPAPLGVEGGCQWLHGNAHHRFFCGAPTSESRVWCEHHLARVYQQAAE